jgi:hypothetical protein
LSVFDHDSGDLLFSLPFFVSENEGRIQTETEGVFARRADLRRSNRLLSQFIYPEFVEFPQFDLAFHYVQNQFWGRTREVEHFDTATPGQVHFYLSQDQAFVSDYTFNTLNLIGFNVDGREVVGVEEDTGPPRVLLRRDVQNLNPSPSPLGGSRFGFPIDEREARYANVQFRLETTSTIRATERIYVVGDFNNWMLNERNRMRYNENSGLWEGSALVKEGRYSYTYVVFRNGQIDDLALDQSFIPSRQEYLTLVYYRDPARNYDRLLQVDRVISN